MRNKTSPIFAFATLLAATTAHATPNFPNAVKSDLSLSSAPSCSLCHTDGNQGGTGTVNTPFGKNMRARGLVAYDTSSLSTALTAMESGKVDSAGSCLPDIEELKAGRDPNTASDLADCAGDGGAPPPATSETAGPDVPAYGCGAEIAPHAKGDGSSLWTFGVLVAFAAGLRARRSRRLGGNR